MKFANIGKSLSLGGNQSNPSYIKIVICSYSEVKYLIISHRSDKSDQVIVECIQDLHLASGRFANDCFHNFCQDIWLTCGQNTMQLNTSHSGQFLSVDFP